MAYSDERDQFSPANDYTGSHRSPYEFAAEPEPEVNIQHHYASQVNVSPQKGFHVEDQIEEGWINEFHEETHWLTKHFWAGTVVRAVRTFVQTAVATLTATGVGLWHAPWWDGLVAASGAAILSVLMSLDREARQ